MYILSQYFIIIFSRSYLSFSLEKENAKRFSGSDDKTFSIIYKIEEVKNSENIPNAYIGEFAALRGEKEVLVFPFCCFEIVDITKSTLAFIHYEITLKYLGNYSDYIKEKLGNNFYDKIQVTNFSYELMTTRILKAQNIFTTWEKKEELNIKLDKIYFFLENTTDCIGTQNNDIIVYNLFLFKIKQRIRIHQDKITDIKKLNANRICSCSKDGTIKVIKFNENNSEFNQIYSMQLNQNYAIHIIFLFSEEIFFIDKENNISFFALKEKDNTYKEITKEEDKILSNMKYLNGKIVYITENPQGKKLIKFIDSQKKEKEQNCVRIEEKEIKLKVLGLFTFQEFILVAYDYRIDYINFQKWTYKVRSFRFFDFEITNMVILSNDKIILGLYDYEKKEAIIR